MPEWSRFDGELADFARADTRLHSGPHLKGNDLLLTRLKRNGFLLEEKAQVLTRISQRISRATQPIRDRRMPLILDGQLKIAPAANGLQGHAEALKGQRLFRLDEGRRRSRQDHGLRGRTRGPGREGNLDIA